MKYNLLAIVAIVITVWLIATANILPDTQTLSITSSHLFNWQITENFDFDSLLVINIFCLPIFIFFLKFLLEKKTKNLNFDLIFIAGLIGIGSALPKAGLVLLISLIVYISIMYTFNNGLEETSKILKLILFFYFSALTFFALSGLGIILTLTISLLVGSLAATIFETFKKSMVFTFLFFLVILMIMIDRPAYYN